MATLHQAERQRKMEAICSRVEAELQEEGERQGKHYIIGWNNLGRGHLMGQGYCSGLQCS